MQEVKISLSLSVLLVFLVLAGCAQMPPRSGDIIGTLRVSGPNVWLNDAPARDGDRVRLGGTLATGPGSSALLEFRDGGSLQLDENTDPVFEWLAQSKCILVRIFKGQAFLEKGHACVQGPNISLILDSELNLLVGRAPAPSLVTLLRGTAEVTAPVRARLLPGQQLVANRARADIRTLSAAELRSVTAWRKEFRFRPLPAPEPVRPAIPFPVIPRPADASPRPEPPPPKPPAKPPALERGIRLPADLIERSQEPVLR